MSEFTEGPWEVFENDDELMVIQSGSLESGHGWVGYLKIATELQGVEDARLIAAAPDLLKELEETHAALCFTSDYIGSERYKRNMAAIAKALGNH